MVLRRSLFLNIRTAGPPVSDTVTTAKQIIANAEKVIVGKRRQVVLSLVSWFCEGHILLEDVPGVGKTVLARNTSHPVLMRRRSSRLLPTTETLLAAIAAAAAMGGRVQPNQGISAPAAKGSSNRL